jgi:hypothetical protein
MAPEAARMSDESENDTERTTHDIIRLITGLTPERAQAVQRLLGKAGIRCMVNDDTPPGVTPAVLGIWVKKDLAGRARAVLAADALVNQPPLDRQPPE